MRQNTPTRAQTELPAIGIAFVFLTVIVVLGTSGAYSALSSAERPALEKQEASGLSDQLVDEHAPVTMRANVLDERAINNLTADGLHTVYGLSSDSDARIQLDGETVTTAGNPDGGTTVDRLVVVEQRIERSLQPSFEHGHTTTLPRRTQNATLDIDPGADATVNSVRANDRVLLANESGLDGQFELDLSRYETKQLSFETAGSLSEGDVSIEYYPTETQKATLTVTVDA